VPAQFFIVKALLNSPSDKNISLSVLGSTVSPKEKPKYDINGNLITN